VFDELRERSGQQRSSTQSAKNLLDFLPPQAYYGRTSNILPIEERLMKIKTFAIYIITVLLVALTWSGAAAADQHSGTWKMNPAKSKYSPGPAAKNITLTIESDETHMKIDSQGTDGSDNPTHIQFDAKFDGKDYPATGLPSGDSVSAKLINANTTQVTMKKDGQPVMTVTSVVSNDGKTRTSTFKGKDPQGREVNNVVVYDKQ
jgi:hypothetical protein